MPSAATVNTNIGFLKSMLPGAYWGAAEDIPTGAALSRGQSSPLDVHTQVERLLGGSRAAATMLLSAQPGRLSSLLTPLRLARRAYSSSYPSRAFRDHPLGSFFFSTGLFFGLGVLAFTPASWGFAIVGSGVLGWNLFMPRYVSPWKTYRHLMEGQRQRLLEVYATFSQALAGYDAGRLDDASTRLATARRQFIGNVCVTRLSYALRQRAADLMRDMERLETIIGAEPGIRQRQAAALKEALTVSLMNELVASYVHALDTNVEAGLRYQSYVRALILAQTIQSQGVVPAGTAFAELKARISADPSSPLSGLTDFQALVVQLEIAVREAEIAVKAEAVAAHDPFSAVRRLLGQVQTALATSDFTEAFRLAREAQLNAARIQGDMAGAAQKMLDLVTDRIREIGTRIFREVNQKLSDAQSAIGLAVAQVNRAESLERIEDDSFVKDARTALITAREGIDEIKGIFSAELREYYEAVEAASRQSRSPAEPSRLIMTILQLERGFEAQVQSLDGAIARRRIQKGSREGRKKEMVNQALGRLEAAIARINALSLSEATFQQLAAREAAVREAEKTAEAEIAKHKAQVALGDQEQRLRRLKNEEFPRVYRAKIMEIVQSRVDQFTHDLEKLEAGSRPPEELRSSVVSALKGQKHGLIEAATKATAENIPPADASSWEEVAFGLLVRFEEAKLKLVTDNIDSYLDEVLKALSEQEDPSQTGVHAKSTVADGVAGAVSRFDDICRVVLPDPSLEKIEVKVGAIYSQEIDGFALAKAKIEKTKKLQDAAVTIKGWQLNLKLLLDRAEYEILSLASLKLGERLARKGSIREIIRCIREGGEIRGGLGSATMTVIGIIGFAERAKDLVGDEGKTSEIMDKMKIQLAALETKTGELEPQLGEPGPEEAPADDPMSDWGGLNGDN